MRRIEVIQLLEFYKFTDKESKELLKSMTILIDTREQENSHITDYFDKAKINYEIRKLDYGDYSVKISKNEQLGIPRDLYFDKQVVVERKGSLDELAGNLTKERDRLKKELSLAPRDKVIMIEDCSYSNLVEGKYRSQFAVKSFLGSLHSLWFAYNAPFFFVDNKKWSGAFIQGFFTYWLKNYLR